MRTASTATTLTKNAEFMNVPTVSDMWLTRDDARKHLALEFSVGNGIIIVLGNTCLNWEGKVVKNDTSYDTATPGVDGSCNYCFEICLCPDWRTTTYNSSTQATDCVSACTKMACYTEDPVYDGPQENEVTHE